MGEVIEKPWCVYRGLLHLLGFGKIEEERDDGVYMIRYSEHQMYLPEPWDPKYVKRFPSLEEAVDYYIKNRPKTDIRTISKTDTEEEIKKRAKRDFPSEGLVE